MSKELIIMPCRIEDVPQVKSFYNTNWRADHPQMKDDLFEWFYHANPARPSAIDYTLMLALQEGEVVGSIAFNPCKFHYENFDYTGAWLGMFMTHPDHRRKGVSKAMLAELQDMYHVLAVTSVSKLGEAAYVKMGFDYCTNFTRYVAVLNAEDCMSLITGIKGYVRNELERRHLLLPGERLYGDDITKEHSDMPPTGVDMLERSCTNKYYIRTVKSREWLKWRYAEHPTFKYTFLEVYKKGILIGLAVVRLEATGGVNVGRVMEFMARKEGEKILASTLTEWGEGNKCCMIDFFSGSAPMPILEQVGFRLSCGMSMPWLFQPIDHDRLVTNFTLWPKTNKEVMVTKGDGDLDRPN